MKSKNGIALGTTLLLFAPFSVSLAQSGTTQTLAAGCDYSNAAQYDGWGWNSTTGQSCAPIDNSASTELTTSSTSTNGGSGCVDPDGDGWGWDGTASCQVEREIAINNTAVDATCTCIDTLPLGDGWGWNGSESCRVLNEGPANSDGIEESERNQLAQTVIIPRVNTAPVIDGIIDYGEWNDAATHDSAGQRNWIDNLIVHERGDYSDYGPCTFWSAMHDGTYLYIRVSNHEEPRHHELWQDSEYAYRDDSIEIFLDGDNSKQSSFDGVDDYMMALRYDDSMPVDWGIRGSRRDLQFTYATSQAFHQTDDYAHYEIAIRMDSAGIYPGDLVGLEIQINEDDDGGDRDAKWSWAERTSEHRAWFDPSAFGTVKLDR